MNRIRIWVPNVAAAVCCLVTAGASAQPLPVPAPAPPLPQVKPAPPAPPMPPGFKTLVPFDRNFARDMARDMSAIYKDAWAWNDPGAWGWPFQGPRQTTGRGGATQTESMDMAFSNPNTPENRRPTTSATSPTGPPLTPAVSIPAAAITASMQTRFTGSDPRRSTIRPATGVAAIVATLTSASSPTACAP